MTAISQTPDGEQAVAAMRFMLTSGVPGMTRLALKVALTSTNGVARGVAPEEYSTVNLL